MNFEAKFKTFTLFETFKPTQTLTKKNNIKCIK